MNRTGTVLVFALLAVLSMELVALAAFGFARIARLGAQHEEAHATLHAAAREALSVAIAGIDARDVASRGIGARWPAVVPAAPAPAIRMAATAERLDAQLVLLHVEIADAGGATLRERALLRILPAGDVVSGFPALVTTAVLPGPANSVERDTTNCGPQSAMAPVLDDWTTRAGADSLPLGNAAGVGWRDLATMAAAFPTGADSARFVVASGDTVISTEFHGFLAAEGDVRLTASARVRGVLVARGVLAIASGARLEGAVRAFSLEDGGGTFVHDRCAIALALDATPFRRAYRAAPRWRLPAF